MIAYLLAAAAAGPWFEPAADWLAQIPSGWRGVAWNDLDGDGDPDLAAGRTGGATIFRNDSGKLVPVFTVDEPRLNGEGIALLDFSGDGRPDLFVANRSGPPRYFENRGNFHFAVVSDDLQDVQALSYAACSADFNNDGWLDLALVTRGSGDDLMFSNVAGRFRLVASALAGSGGDGRTCAVGDWSGDGRPDIYIGNFVDRSGARPRRETDRLYVNMGKFSFTRLTEGHVVNLPSMTYGATSVDWNEDGYLDLAVAHDGRADRNVLYDNMAQEVGRIDLYPRGFDLGLGNVHRGPSKGQVFADFDNDGDFDVFYGEGTEGLTPEHAPFDARDEFYERSGNRFVHRVEPEVDPGGLFGAGAAQADVDGDGDLDLVVANWGGGEQGEPLKLYRNRVGGRSLAVALNAIGTNRQAIGARLTLHARKDGKVLQRHAWLWPQTGFGSMAEPVVHFGLGSDETPVGLTVRWPDGTSFTYPVPKDGGRVRLDQASADGG